MSPRYALLPYDTFEFLAANPGMDRCRADLGFPEMRSRHVRDFPRHLIFHRALPDRVQGLRVLHGARYLPPALSMNQPKRAQRLGADKDGSGNLCPLLIFGLSVVGSWSQCAAFGPWWLPMNRFKGRARLGLRAGGRTVASRPARNPNPNPDPNPAPSHSGSGVEITALGGPWILSPLLRRRARGVH